jgi:hypothetical protein
VLALTTSTRIYHWDIAAFFLLRHRIPEALRRRLNIKLPSTPTLHPGVTKHRPRKMADFAKPEIFASKNPAQSMMEIEIEKTVTVDTVHNDEAVKVLINYTGEEIWTEKEEKNLRRKIDRRLLPILCITYGLQVSALPQSIVTKSSSYTHMPTGWTCRTSGADRMLSS